MNLQHRSLKEVFFLLFVNKCKIISILSCEFSENEYNNLHKQRREEVQK